MKSFLLLIAFLMIFNVIIRVSVRYQKRKAEEKEKKVEPTEREKTLLSLKEIGKYELGGYEGETKKEMSRIKKKSQELMERFMKEDYEKEKEFLRDEYYELIEQEKEFKILLKNHIQEWLTLETDMEKQVEYMRNFYETRTFYPHEFVHDTNRLQRKLERVKEKRKKDPFSPLNEYRVFIDEQKENVKTFLDLHERVTKTLDRLDPTKEQAHPIKHDLYVALQQTEYKKAEKLLRELKRYIYKKKND